MEKQTEIIINETVDGAPANGGRIVATRRRGAGSGSGSGDAKGSRKGSAEPGAGKEVKKRPKADPYIWGIYLGLLFISIIELFSASSSEVRGANVYEPLIRHGIFLAMGFVSVIFLQNIHYGYFSRFATFFAAISFLLLLFSTFFGAEINGAQRAIRIAGFTIQPPEIVKLTVVVLLATILGRNQQPGGVATKAVVMVAVVVLLFAAVLWVNGLTNTILLMGVSIAMFLIGGIQWRKFWMVIGFYAVGVGLLVAVKYATPKTTEFDEAAASAQTEMVAKASSGAGRQETHIGRIKRHIRGVHPGDTIDDLNRQVIFAKMAQAHGGVIGQGPGNSRENARLPLAFSDYIFSIVVEDIGFIGGAALLLLYLFLLARAGRIAYKCNRAFPAFLIMGCAVLIVFQALVHMAIVTGVFPVSGQPLPFISKGGTSVLVMSVAIGIMLSVSRFAVTTTDKKANKEELNILPDDMKAANVTNQG